jgi:hypothetical protein
MLSNKEATGPSQRTHGGDSPAAGLVFRVPRTKAYVSFPNCLRRC